MTRALAILPFLVALAACERNVAPSRTPPVQDVSGSQGAPILPAQQAVVRADITRTDLETLTAADIDKALSVGPGCRFAYSRTSSPILVVRAAEGGEPGRAVVKVHGALVVLEPRSDSGLGALKAGARLSADGLRLAVTPLGEAEADARVREAELQFALQQGLEVGYRGFYACDAPEGPAERS